MQTVTLVYILIAAVLVFVIAAVVVGREAHRLDAVAPRSVYIPEEALEFVAEYLPVEAQAHLTPNDLEALLRFHRLHHRSQVTTPLSGLSMSTVETLGWMVGYLLPLILLSRWLAVSLDAFAAYLIYHWGGNILGHINAELMPRAVARGLLSYAAHPFTYHSLHHARWTGHFGL